MMSYFGIANSSNKMIFVGILITLFGFTFAIDTTDNVLQHLPKAHNALSFTKFVGSAVAMSKGEENGKMKCSFAGADCPVEKIEHEFVQKYMIPSDIVLETGARFGTTSCEIAHKQNNTGLMVSVEPDAEVWKVLNENRVTHNCNFWLLQGVIASRPMISVPEGYAGRTKLDSSQLVGGGMIQYDENNPKRFFNFKEIQTITGLTFTALLIDCEGCINDMFQVSNHAKSTSNAIDSVGDINTIALGHLLKNVRTIIIEGDMHVPLPMKMNKKPNSPTIMKTDCRSNCVDYSKWEIALNAIGLATVYKQEDAVFKPIVHYVFQRQ